MFVDDEEMTRKTFERIASQEFPVLLAGDVAEAKEVLQQHGDEIGVLLTDQRMPGGLGVELLEYARDLHPSIVRMLTTAYSELEDAIAAVNRGEIIRYIEKPWSNIDALLIDLRVAMRFHLLERSNQELMAEKMSAKARGARVERLQVLAALASAQPEPEASLRGLEAMLRNLSDLRSEDDPGSVTEVSELYSGPIEEVFQAITLADRFSKTLAASTGKVWSDLVQVPVTGSAANQPVPESLGEDSAELVARAMAALQAGTDGVQVSFCVEAVDGGIELRFSTGGEGSSLFSSWVNQGSTKESMTAVADLLKLYCIVYPAGGSVSIALNGDLVTDITIIFSDVGNGTNISAQDSDWLEDIVILFS